MPVLSGAWHHVLAPDVAAVTAKLFQKLAGPHANSFSFRLSAEPAGAATRSCNDRAAAVVVILVDSSFIPLKFFRRNEFPAK